MRELQDSGRLAFRVEGRRYVAYYAEMQTMKDAIEIGSILMRLVEDCPERHRQFIQLMQDAMTDAMGAAVGEEPVWNAPRSAPESERGGNA